MKEKEKRSFVNFNAQIDLKHTGRGQKRLKRKTAYLIFIIISVLPDKHKPISSTYLHVYFHFSEIVYDNTWSTLRAHVCVCVCVCLQHLFLFRKI